MRQDRMRKRVRLCASAAAVLLLGTEILIGQFADGWVRSYLGDVLVVPLVYAVIRVITPCRPRFGFILPTAVLLFACAVEFLQLIGIGLDVLQLRIALLYHRADHIALSSLFEVLSYIIEGSLPQLARNGVGINGFSALWQLIEH